MIRPRITITIELQDTYEKYVLDTKMAEQLEDDIAALAYKSGFAGLVEDEITGNVTIIRKF